jgi:hypothetical protein
MSVFYSVNEKYGNRDGDTESDCLLFTDDRDEAFANAAGLLPRRLGGCIAVIQWEERDGGWAGQEIEREEAVR